MEAPPHQPPQEPEGVACCPGERHSEPDWLLGVGVHCYPRVDRSATPALHHTLIHGDHLVLAWLGVTSKLSFACTYFLHPVLRIHLTSRCARRYPKEARGFSEA